MTSGAGARVASLSREGLVLDVLDSGPLDGPPVVLLHGFPQRAASWAAVSTRLHEAGLRTLALDQRGYSPGARPAGVRPYGLAHLVGDAAALVAQVGGRAHVVGHDWGANVAWALAASRPDLVVSLTALSVPHPRAFTGSLRHLDQARRSWYVAGFQVPRLPERMLAGPRGAAAMRASGMDDAMVATYQRDVVEAGALPYAVNWYRALRHRQRGGFGRPVRVPTTYVWSDHDTALGRHGALACADHVEADYTFRTVEGASHWLVDQHPDVVADAVLDRVSRSAGL